MEKDKEIKMKKIGNPIVKPMIFVSIICILSIVACIWSSYRLSKVPKKNKEEPATLIITNKK